MRIAVFAATLVLAATPSSAALKHKVLYSFGATATDGAGPQDGLIADTNGTLYGTTFGGGDFSQGAVFTLSRTGVEHVIYSFHGAPNDGAQPSAALTLGSDGNLYGTTLLGGAANMGTAFRLVPNGASWQEEELYSFCAQASCADGSFAASPITIAPHGDLFGTTESGGSGAAQADSGVLYRLRPGKPGHPWKETVLHDFCMDAGCVDGQAPQAARLLLRHNVLYGTTSQGQQRGTLYSLNASGGGFQTLTQGFNGGGRPLTGVVADKHGTLYGTTAFGGAIENGTVYSYDPATATFRLLYQFGLISNVRTPNGGLVLTENEQGVTLYGASQTGGVRNGGAVYKLTPGAGVDDPWIEQNLYDFCRKKDCVDGSNPNTATLLHLGSAFYGTTFSGGANNAGTIYRMAP